MSGVHIAWLNWRDTANPEGGGSEVYLERIAQGLVGRGHRVTVVCAAHDAAPPDEVKNGVRFLRRGSKLGVYGQARRLLRSSELADVDVVVDTQNGLPFFATWATRAPVVVLVHHVHREQWPVVYDPVRARAGWLVESRIAPWAYRRCRYVAVSGATRAELMELGVDPRRITVVHNGTDPADGVRAGHGNRPRILVLGRLVPHKRVEHVLAAARVLRADFPDLQVAVVGDGWWSEHLVAEARRLEVDDIVEFTGHVDADAKAAQLDQARVLALPSLKEGWGLVVMEAAARGVPTVAYAAAGGVGESISAGTTGILVDGDGEAGITAFTAALRRVLSDDELRDRLGEAARRHAQRFSWDAATDAFEAVLHDAAGVTARAQLVDPYTT